MIELDKTKVYSLEDLTSDEKNQLLEKLIELDNTWDGALSKKELFTSNFLYFTYNYKPDGEWLVSDIYFTNKEVVNAKELFYTLENIQVDCRELSEEHIKQMADVFEANGFYIGSLNLIDKYYFLRDNFDKYCLVAPEDYKKTTITYSKFMELFGNKEENFKKLVEVLNEELTEEAYKETEYEVKYIAEKPKQYQIGIDTFNPQPHYNNENGSLYKIANDLGLNHWEFDIFKRLVRCRKKNQFKEDLQKIKDTIDIYLNEFTDEK